MVVSLVVEENGDSRSGGETVCSRASTMLLEMSMKMGSKQMNPDVRDLATRRANRQQQRILVQVSGKIGNEKIP